MTALLALWVVLLALSVALLIANRRLGPPPEGPPAPEGPPEGHLLIAVGGQVRCDHDVVTMGDAITELMMMAAAARIVSGVRWTPSDDPTDHHVLDMDALDGTAILSILCGLDDLVDMMTDDAISSGVDDLLGP